MTDNLRGLIDRLEKLEGPSEYLDEAVWEAIGGWPEREWRSVNYMKAFGTPLTASLDAAVALVERLGLQWLRKSPVAMTVYRPLTREQDERKEWAVHHSAAGATPAIALLIAALLALQENSNER